MTDIVGAVGGLRLAAQHHLVDQWRFRRAGDAAQHAIEIARMQLIAGRQLKCRGHAGTPRSASSFSSDGGACTRYMQGWWQALQFLGRGDIGQDHELLDQPVAVQARAGRTAVTRPLVVEHDFPFGQVEIERAARLPCGQQGAKGGVEMRQRQSPRS